MSRLMIFALGLAITCTGCVTAPPTQPAQPLAAALSREPVAQEPDIVTPSGECAALGMQDMADLDPSKVRLNPQPYGWAQLRYDVERGVVVHAEVMNSSPKKLFDAQTIALFKSMRFPSLASARGCVANHKWG